MDAEFPIELAQRWRRPFQRSELREDIVYACVFFGIDGQAFRRSAIEYAVLATVSQAGGECDRADLLDRIALSLELASNQHRQVRSAMDRMLQDGRLRGKNGVVAIDPAALDPWVTVRALKEHGRDALRREVDAALAPWVRSKTGPKEAVEAVLEDLGALLLDSGVATSEALGGVASTAMTDEPLRRRIRHLGATLDTIGIAEERSRNDLIRDLTRRAAASTFGRALAAGEVFLNLLNLKTPRLEGLFKQYNIRCESLRASAPSRKKAEQALAFAARERIDPKRPKILLDHDAETLGWLFDQAAEGGVVDVLCTWDKLHPQVQKQEGADWDVLDPVVLGDTLSLAAPGDQEVRIASPVVIALALSDEAEKRGAEVWDKLVAVEKDKLHDARLREEARAFKRAWLVEAERSARGRDLQEAWEQWKAEHLAGVVGEQG